MDLSINIFNHLSMILKDNFVNILKDQRLDREEKKINDNFVIIVND